MQSNYVIETDNLSKSYNANSVVEHLNLRVPENSIFGFLGPNGAGKSTTIKMLLGLTRPTQGSARIFDLDVQQNASALRARVGYLPQTPRFYHHMTAREILKFVLGFYYEGANYVIEDRISETLNLMGLEDKADRQIGSFSGGERQRLGIAQAQVNYPDLLILDEPAASLDPQGRHDVLRIMKRLQKYTTIFFSTHILDDVQKISDHVAILNQGQMIAQAPIEVLLADSDKMKYRVITQANHESTIEKDLVGYKWISSIEKTTDAGRDIWYIQTINKKIADALLLRKILENPNTNVLDFRCNRFELEDVFLQLVEESNNAK